MKKIIISVMILIVSAQSFGQQASLYETATTNDYLLKSKRQKTTAWVLLGGGFVVSVVSIAAGTVKTINDPGVIIDEKGLKGETVVFGVGLVSMAGSIPFFISASKNKRKAVSMSGSLKMEKISVIQNRTLVQTSYPALSLKIDLK